MARALLNEARERGCRIEVQGERLVLWAPPTLPSDLRERLRAHRDELREIVGREQGTHLFDGPVREQRQDAVAWRLYSRLLDCEVWLARDERTAADLFDEGIEIPVLLLDEVPHLVGKPPELLRAVLRTKGAFPAARWTQ